MITRMPKARGAIGRAALTAAALGLAIMPTVPACAAASPAPSAPATTAACASPSVPMYHVDNNGQLRRWSYSAAADGGPGVAEQLIGSGWGGATVVAGGSGVLFLVDGSGNLRWYRDTKPDGSGGAAWDPASGAVIGTGWNAFTQVVSGGQGVLYAVDSSGFLRWYRYTGSNGGQDWAPGSGSVVGSAWADVDQLAAAENGVLYAQLSDGSLRWYRHLDPQGGAASWANGGVGSTIGTGWSFTRLGSLGGGILLARSDGGALSWYRDTDPYGGTPSWVDGGQAKPWGTGWNGSALLTDPAGCTASTASTG